MTECQSNPATLAANSNSKVGGPTSESVIQAPTPGCGTKSRNLWFKAYDENVLIESMVTYCEFHGIGPPEQTLGNSGDVYLDLTPQAYELYGKTNRGWVKFQPDLEAGNPMIPHPNYPSMYLWAQYGPNGHAIMGWIAWRRITRCVESSMDFDTSEVGSTRSPSNEPASSAVLVESKVRQMEEVELSPVHTSIREGIGAQTVLTKLHLELMFEKKSSLEEYKCRLCRKEFRSRTVLDVLIQHLEVDHAEGCERLLTVKLDNLWAIYHQEQVEWK
ncbi:hypothetical protein C8J56DRAFT_890403 [Mycena floridula]|nr:hypothetical protein C8J56DRAFT_890403 [Mycena floridula]